MINIDLINFQELEDQVLKELGQMRSGKFVTIGIHEEAGNVESGDLTMASLGAVHEFGAEINHPGGTSYGYASKAAADRDQVRFLKKGAGYMELGVTQAHKIEIPARPWLEPGVVSATEEVTKIIEDGIAADQPLDQILEAIGVVAAGTVKVYMTELKTPPNAASTIRKKGSSNPLIDSGAMRASVTYQVQQGAAQEGLE